MEQEVKNRFFPTSRYPLASHYYHYNWEENSYCAFRLSIIFLSQRTHGPFSHTQSKFIWSLSLFNLKSIPLVILLEQESLNVTSGSWENWFKRSKRVSISWRKLHLCWKALKTVSLKFYLLSNVSVCHRKTLSNRN